jgi:hypothetical protein
MASNPCTSVRVVLLASVLLASQAQAATAEDIGAPVTPGAISPIDPRLQHILGEGMATEEQLLPDGSVPPYREEYSLPSVRRLAPETLWEHITKAAGVVLVGVKDRDPRGYFRGKVLVDEARVEAIKKQLQHEIRGLELVDIDKPVPRTGTGSKYPVFKAHLNSVEAPAGLKKSPLVDYVELTSFEGFQDSIACTKSDYHAKALDSADGKFRLDDADGNSEAGVDFDLVPYPFQYMGVDSAWRRLIHGSGVGYGYPGGNRMVGVLDSGASADQDQLNGRFALGSSRPPATHLTAALVTAGDTCGHGTRIAALATAPRDGSNIIGVAWGAPLVTVKVDNNPIVTGGTHTIDVFAICDGIMKVKTASARVISMAFGLSYTSPTISQCIKDAYDTAPEVIFVAAAGTTFSWVVFPAVMNREVLAVSLVEINPLGGFKLLPFMQVAYGSGGILLKRDPVNTAPAEDALLSAIGVTQQQKARRGAEMRSVMNHAYKCGAIALGAA